MIPAPTTVAVSKPQDTCASVQKVVTTSKQQRYQQRLKDARKRRKEKYLERRDRDRHMTFDGRRGGQPVSGVPKLGTLKLEIYSSKKKENV